MSYQTYVTRDFPYLFATADAIAGGRVVAPLVRGLGTAAAIETGDTATFTFPGFTQSRRDQAWALEAWFVPLGGNSKIIGHAEGDGILWEDNKIVFRIRLSDENVDVAYTPDQIRTFHVVAQYARDNMTLYVNGEMVNYYTFTDAQASKPLLTFVNENQLASSGNHIIDALAFYTTDVPAAMPADHYEYGSFTNSMSILTGSFGGAMYEQAYFEPSTYYQWNESNWGWRDFVGLGLDSAGLYATEAGSIWRDNLIIDATADALYLDFVAYGNVTIEYSLNGGAWTVPSRLTKITSAAVEDIAVRATFVDTNARLASLSVVSATNVYLNETAMERPVEVTFAANPRLFYPIDNEQFGGARGIATVEPSATTLTRAVEFWVRPNVNAIVSNFTNFPGTSYVNGVAATALPQNEWSHVFINMAADENVTRTIGGNGAVEGNGRWACPTLYPATLTTTQITELYNSYFGKDVTQVISTGFMTIADPTFDSYAYDWSPVGLI